MTAAPLIVTHSVAAAVATALGHRFQRFLRCHQRGLAGPKRANDGRPRKGSFSRTSRRRRRSDRGCHVAAEPHAQGFVSYSDHLLTDGAVHFLREHGRRKPFFLYLPYTAPSAPLQDPNHKPSVPKISTAWDTKDWQAGTRQTYALIAERLDQGIGKVLGTLDDLRLTENTLVVFASDNGGNDRARNTPFSGYTSELFDGGIHVPCIVRWPGVLPAGVVTDRVTITLDLSASLLHAAGIRPSANQPLDGIDILTEIKEDRVPQSRTLFWRARRADHTWRAVREGSLKYLSLQDGGGFDEYLFDLAADPGEKTNLIGGRPEDTQRLKQLLTGWEKETRPRR